MKAGRGELLDYVVRTIEELSRDWDYSRPVGPESLLFTELGLESLDVVGAGTDPRITSSVMDKSRRSRWPYVGQQFRQRHLELVMLLDAVPSTTTSSDSSPSSVKSRDSGPTGRE